HTLQFVYGEQTFKSIDFIATRPVPPIKNAVHLVTVSASTADVKLSIPQEAIDLLKTLPSPLYVVALCGAGRSCTSFPCTGLASRFAEQQTEAIWVLPSANRPTAVTHGVDFVPLCVGEAKAGAKQSRGTVLLLDVEGLDNDATSHHNGLLA